jgi:hypothetical protein
MIAPAAQFIEMAMDRMTKDTEYMTRNKVILDQQLIELDCALYGQPESFHAGYALGIEVCRILLEGMPSAVKAGVQL